MTRQRDLSVRQLEAAAVKRWRRGQEMTALEAARLQAEEGAKPQQAVAESLSALNALQEMGMWPAPRDPMSERGVEEVRPLWVKVQRRPMQARAQMTVASLTKAGPMRRGAAKTGATKSRTKAAGARNAGAKKWPNAKRRQQRRGSP